MLDAADEFRRREFRIERHHPLGNVLGKVADSLEMARQRFPGQRNSLDALCRRFGVDNSHRHLHGALLDAQILAEVFLALTSGQGEIGFAAEEKSAGAVVAEFAAAGGPRPRITATEEDLAAHDARLAVLRKKAGGRAVWDALLEEDAPEAMPA